MKFKEINIRDVKENPVKLRSNDWALLTAKNGESCNPMTVSWGGIGELWGKDMATVYVRESRFTKTLIDKEDYFSLCFFSDEYKNALKICNKYKLSSVKVYPINENEYISSSQFKENDNKHIFQFIRYIP